MTQNGIKNVHEFFKDFSKFVVGGISNNSQHLKGLNVPENELPISIRNDMMNHLKSLTKIDGIFQSTQSLSRV
jgi:hypothetical protein